MSENTFKKVIYILSSVAIVLVCYLAFAKKHTANDSATLRNGKYLGLKLAPSVSVDVSNQKDLTLDSSSDGSKSADTNSQTQETSSTNASGKSAGLYTVKEGDTYGCIAETYYGSYEHWPDIFNANAGYGNGFSEYELHVGAVLELPAISAENLKPTSKLCS